MASNEHLFEDFEDFEDSGQPLRTPDSLEHRVEFFDDKIEDENISDESENESEENDESQTTVTSTTTATTVTSTTTTTNVTDEIPFVVDDWIIVDLPTGRTRPPRQHEFLKLLLQNPLYGSLVSWIDQSIGLFVINQPESVAKLWQRVKNRHSDKPMTYNTFARGIRHYYKSQIMIRTNKKFTFQFNVSRTD